MRAVWLGLVVLVGACSQAPESGPGTSDAVAAAPEPIAQVQDPLVLGEKIYGEYCFSCHTPGLSGAPKLGDVEAWAPRIAKGEALLLAATIEGVPPAMPPRGICMSCSDDELANAIAYMIAKSQ